MSKYYDITILGATGYSGKLAAKYVVLNYPNLKIALAGRSKSKLNELNNQLNNKASILIGDINDESSILSITEQTKVLFSAAGPYSLYGDIPVKCCIKTKTDYCDITGEPLWVKSIIDRFHTEAVENNVLIVPFCGFDSIPSDIGTVYALDCLNKRYPGAIVGNVDNVFKLVGGSASGGTAATLLNMAETGLSELSKVFNPYSLAPNPEEFKLRTHDADPALPSYNDDLKCWTSPFIMAYTNSRVVRRSAAINNYPKTFSYQERMYAKNIFISCLISFGIMIAGLLLMIPYVPTLAKKFVPQPGEGLAEADREKAFFQCSFATHAVRGDEKIVLKTRVKGKEAYFETGKFAIESAVIMATTRELTLVKGGVMTPASAFGMNLVNRLQAKEIEFTEL